MIKQLIYTTFSFILIDATWIMFVVNPTYKKYLPSSLMLETPKLLYALIFYAIFIFSLWYLVINEYNPNSQPSITLIKAFVFGVASYATYSFTNMAVIEGWNLFVAISDTLWGGILAVLVTWVVLFASK